MHVHAVHSSSSTAVSKNSGGCWLILVYIHIISSVQSTHQQQNSRVQPQAVHSSCKIVIVYPHRTICEHAIQQSRRRIGYHARTIPVTQSRQQNRLLLYRYTDKYSSSNRVDTLLLLLLLLYTNIFGGDVTTSLFTHHRLQQQKCDCSFGTKKLLSLSDYLSALSIYLPAWDRYAYRNCCGRGEGCWLSFPHPRLLLYRASVRGAELRWSACLVAQMPRLLRYCVRK